MHSSCINADDSLDDSDLLPEGGFHDGLAGGPEETGPVGKRLSCLAQVKSGADYLAGHRLQSRNCQILRSSSTGIRKGGSLTRITRNSVGCGTYVRERNAIRICFDRSCHHHKTCG